MNGINISNLESTLTKNQAKTLLKHIFLGEITSWKIYQFKVKYGIEDKSYGSYDYDTANAMLLQMKEASKGLDVVVEHILEVIKEADERSEEENNQNRCKRNRRI
jgi:hypothetical protein